MTDDRLTRHEKALELIALDRIKLVNHEFTFFTEGQSGNYLTTVTYDPNTFEMLAHNCQCKWVKEQSRETTDHHPCHHVLSAQTLARRILNRRKTRTARTRADR